MGISLVSNYIYFFGEQFSFQITVIKIQVTTIGPFVKTCFTSSLGISVEIYNGFYALSTHVPWHVFYV